MSRPRRMMQPVAQEPRLRRAYFDCRYGQLHVHYGMPMGGGFDEGTPLLCLPGAPGSGRFFRPLLLPLARDRCVYAPDLPGCGESDPAPSGGPAELATGLGDFLELMHLRHVDLLAHEDGVRIALALAEQRPGQVSRVVLSPSTDAVRAEARALRAPVLLIDLGAGGAGGTGEGELERQAGRLREFLGLA